MNYIIDRENGLYIIKLGNSLNDELYQKVIRDILKTKNLENKVYCYYTSFNKNHSYCILDFNHRKYSEEEVETIVKKKN